MLGRRMVGALLVMGGMTLFLSAGVAFVIEETDAVYRPVETRAPADSSPVVPLGAALSLAGGIVLLFSSARPVR